MNPITWIQELQGPALIALICGSLFLEELGVPLPFAPGDIVLALAGIAIAAGRVNPVAMLVALALSIVIGAMLGRELTALLGWQRLMRLAERIHARRPLEQASRLLQRGGWRTIFTARLLPGMRVYTTQMAGVSEVPRLVFLEGLLPATVVYLAAFVGLGVALGRPVLALIKEAEHQVLVGVGLLLAVVVLIVLTRVSWRRARISLQAGGWTGPFRFSLDSVGTLLILGSLGLNFAGHAIAQAFQLPLFLDSTGTVLAGVVGGPWVGASVGFISNLIAANTVDPIAAPYAIVSFVLGFAAGLTRYLNWQRRLSGWVSLWLLCFAVAAVVSTPINFLMSSGKSGVAFGDSIYTGLLGLHVPAGIAAFVGEAAIDLPDKLITVFAALWIVQAGIGQPRVSSPSAAQLDLREAFTFVVRSGHWIRRTLAATVCLLFAWLVIPYFLLAGYVVELGRSVRAGGTELPPWNRRWRKIGDGFKLTLALLIWFLPGVILNIPTAIVSAMQEQPHAGIPASIVSLTAIVASLGSVWLILVLVLEAPIISQFLERGLRGALSPRGVIRRFRINVALSIVVGALIVVLSFLGFLGLLAFLVGVLLTIPYASFVGAYLVGLYARQTSPIVSGDLSKQTA